MRCVIMGSLVLLVSAGIAAERPSGSEIQQRMTVQVQAVPTPQGLLLRWTPANQAPSDGIKIVASTEHHQPVHGHGLDPVLAWIGGTGHQETLISGADLMRLAQGKDLALRLCFVRVGAHEDPQAHLAYSNVIVVRPSPAVQAGGHQHEGHAHKGVLRPRLPERGHWQPPAQQAGHAPVRPAEAIASTLRERVSTALAERRAEASALPPPAELARDDLRPDERELVTRIHALELRKQQLEGVLARLEAQAGEAE
jgi:hypothetical protein